MVSVRRTISALLLATVASSLLGGCGFLHRHFDRKDDAYKKSVAERPLEIPPDLDTPNGSGALVVPPAGGAAVAGGATSSAVPTMAAGQGAQLAGDGLRIADSVESAWSRVGLALERSGAATVLGRDEAARTYTVQTTGHATTKPGWFKRAISFGRGGTQTTAQVQLTVRVSADGNGSRVSIEGGTDDASQDAARTLLATLKQRLS